MSRTGIDDLNAASAISSTDLLPVQQGDETFKATGTQLTTYIESVDVDNLTQGSTNLFMTGAERTKLSGIETGATANTGALADLDTVAVDQIDAESITEVKLLSSNTPTDNYVLSYNDATGGFTWVEQSAGGGSNISVEDEGSELTSTVTSFNFVGTGVTATNTGGAVTVTVAGGSAPVDSVNTQTGEVVLDADDIDDSSTDHKFVTAGDLTNLGNLSGTNTGDQTITLTGDVTGSGTGSFEATVTEGAVTQHQAALSITESQISDLGSYITDYTVTEGDVTAHEAALTITESQVSDLGDYVESDPTGVTGADAITNILSLTQSEYDATTPDSATFYIITDA